jgi:cytochrome c5
VGITCAACHAGAIRGVTIPGAPNDGLRVGDWWLAWEATLADDRLEYDAVKRAAERRIGALAGDEAAELRRWLAARPRPPVRPDADKAAMRAWGAGRSAYRFAGAPARILPLWATGARYNSDGAWTDLRERNRHALWLLGTPLDTARSQEATRLLNALSGYVAGLAPPMSPYDVDRGLAMRGAAVFKAHCASCHDRSGELLTVEEVGTDDRLLREESPIYRLTLRGLGFDGVDVRFWPRFSPPAASQWRYPVARRPADPRPAATSRGTCRPRL